MSLSASPVMDERLGIDATQKIPDLGAPHDVQPEIGIMRMEQMDETRSANDPAGYSPQFCPRLEA